MKLIQMSTKLVTSAQKGQAEKCLFGLKTGRAGLVVVLAACLGAPPAYSQTNAATSSPLEILSHAPKVRIEDDPTPTPRPPVVTPELRNAPAPYAAPRSNEAPYIQPVPPAFTPYTGRSATGASPAQQPGNYYNNRGAATPPPFSNATPTPRPVLGPEDVERNRSGERKGGIVRGLIRAIPFIGGDDEEEAEVTPTPAQDQRLDGYPSNLREPDYRGYDAPANDNGAPILRPPGSAPLPPDPEPSSPSMLGNQPMRGDVPMQGVPVDPPGATSPPILTPEPRIPQPPLDDNPVDLDTSPAGDPGAPLLTVKRETDETSPSVSEDVAPAAPAALANPTPAHIKSAPADGSKEPALERRDVESTPRPLERATTGVLIQESRPEQSLGIDDDSLGPKPDASAVAVEAYDPTVSVTPVVNDVISSLTIEQSDLGMPNPAYEQNTVVLGEFQSGVRKARAQDYAGAALAFREYATNHPSSGLAPRAAFLSVIFEDSRSQAKANMETLKRLFPESHYVKEARNRRGDEIGLTDEATAVADAGNGAAAGEAVVTTETPEQQIARLERELTVAVGDPSQEPELRKRLGVLYLEQEEYDRAYEVLRPAAEMAQDQPVNGEILIALGRTLVARGETVQAISLYEAVDARFPGLIEKDAASAWSAGLAFEGAGRYNKARTLYNLIRQNWAGTAEAQWATSRLNDLSALR